MNKDKLAEYIIDRILKGEDMRRLIFIAIGYYILLWLIALHLIPV